MTTTTARAPASGPTPARRPARVWLDWLALVGYAVATSIAVGCALAIAVALTASATMAQTPAPARDAPRLALPIDAELPAPRGLGALPAPLEALPRFAQADEAGGAALLFRTTQGMVAAPLVATDARLRVTGTSVRTVVRQRFANPSEDWLEGVYVFPLPEDSAVDHLRMRVGDRVVEGRIQEREAARLAHAAARDAGRRSTLIEQQRPNLFTSRVANIGPWASIEIEIEYQQVLTLKDGAWRLRMPTVVAPRYAGGAADAAAIDAPVIEPGAGEPPPITISAIIDAGVPITTPRSVTHAVRIAAGPRLARADGIPRDPTEAGAGEALALRYEVSLEGPANPDRDFELEWAPATGARPAAALRVEPHRGRQYALLVLTPPAPAETPGERLRRETTFVVDTSGSMAGASIEQARHALAFGIERLVPGDRFNLIRFSSRHESLYPAPRALDARTRREALAWVRGLRADGGTEMRGALEQALSAPAAPGHVGQIVFLTDGAVGYEDEMLALIGRQLGERRLFTIGIGSAPNSYFMRKAAEAGRGTFTYVGRVEEVERRMAALFAKLAQPLATDITVRFEGADPDEPIAAVRDLYAGEPIVLGARFREAPVGVVVTGRRGDARWSLRADTVRSDGSGLHVLWARDKVATLTDAMRHGLGAAGPMPVLRAEVVRLGLEHHIVTPYTSLVAVDTEDARPPGATLRSAKAPAALPAGWSFDAVYGEARLAQGATPATQRMLVGALMLAAALACSAMLRRRRPRAARRARGVAPLAGATHVHTPLAQART